jgi:hypothetical protein
MNAFLAKTVLLYGLFMSLQPSKLSPDRKKRTDMVLTDTVAPDTSKTVWVHS